MELDSPVLADLARDAKITIPLIGLRHPDAQTRRLSGSEAFEHSVDGEEPRPSHFHHSAAHTRLEERDVLKRLWARSRGL